MASPVVERDFDIPTAAHLFVEIGKGAVHVRITESSGVRVRVQGRDAELVRIEEHGEEVRVVGPRVFGFGFGDPSLTVTVEVPTDSDVAARTGSADITLQGTAGSATLRSGSGDIRVEAVADTSMIESGSGDVHVGEAAGALRVKSGSGDVTIGSARESLAVSTGSGDVSVDSTAATIVMKSGSGDLRVREARSDVTMTTGSGDVAIATAHRGRVTTKGASGDVRVGVPPTTPVWTDLSTVSGRIRSELPGAGTPEEGADYVELRATTVSGDIVLVPA